ncbi:hypothetical protein ABW21_db0203011 [Orbilia brochopaga]|nr:hypothetical protein ABW21_db0203011 [Drechslerella brochopaga]
MLSQLMKTLFGYSNATEHETGPQNETASERKARHARNGHRMQKTLERLRKRKRTISLVTRIIVFLAAALTLTTGSLWTAYGISDKAVTIRQADVCDYDPTSDCDNLYCQNSIPSEHAKGYPLLHYDPTPPKDEFTDDVEHTLIGKKRKSLYATGITAAFFILASFVVAILSWFSAAEIEMLEDSLAIKKWEFEMQIVKLEERDKNAADVEDEKRIAGFALSIRELGHKIDGVQEQLLKIERKQDRTAYLFFAKQAGTMEGGSLIRRRQSV